MAQDKCHAVGCLLLEAGMDDACRGCCFFEGGQVFRVIKKTDFARARPVQRRNISYFQLPCFSFRQFSFNP